MMRSQDGDKRPGRKGSTRWTCQTRPASPAQPCWSASAPFLINFCSFSDLILVLFWSIAGQFCWLNSGEDAVSLVKCSTVFCVFCKGAVSHVQCSSLFVLLPQILLVLQRSSVPPKVFVCFATFNISLLSSLVARTSRWKLKVVHQPSFLFLEIILVLCYLERKLVTQYLVYNLPKDLSEFCSLAKNNGRWCLRSERSWETGGNGRWPTWGRNAMQAVALHWPQRGAHPPNITYCPTILRQNHQNTHCCDHTENIGKKTIYWKILPLSGLNVVPMHPPTIAHSPPPARFQQLCDEYLWLGIGYVLTSYFLKSPSALLV